jgi:hypothetical protein
MCYPCLRMVCFVVLFVPFAGLCCLLFVVLWIVLSRLECSLEVVLVCSRSLVLVQGGCRPVPPALWFEGVRLCPLVLGSVCGFFGVLGCLVWGCMVWCGGNSFCFYFLYPLLSLVCPWWY